VDVAMCMSVSKFGNMTVVRRPRGVYLGWKDCASSRELTVFCECT